MGKRRKKSHKYNYSNPQPVTDGSAAIVSTTPKEIDKNLAVYNAHQSEYQMISSDLIRVVIINGIFLAGVIALYFINKSNPFLESWFDKIF